MKLLPLGLLSLLWFNSIFALHESDVGIIDWYKPLVGVPHYSSFHRFGTENTRSIILTATESNVLAALNPDSGSIGEYAGFHRPEGLLVDWRYVFEPKDPIISFFKHENGKVTSYLQACISEYTLQLLLHCQVQEGQLSGYSTRCPET
jgi:ER membrane protein complex subunit 1